MNVLYLTEAEVRSLITMDVALEAVEAAFRKISLDEAVNIPRQRCQTDHVMLHVLPAAAKTLDSYVDSAAGQTLMDAPPQRGTIVRTTERADIGVTEWTLSNGATVVLKPTTLRADQILFRAVAPGGTSLVTTLPAPMVAPSPMVRPQRIVALVPMETRWPIRVGITFQSASVCSEPSGFAARGNLSLMKETL